MRMKSELEKLEAIRQSEESAEWRWMEQERLEAERAEDLSRRRRFGKRGAEGVWETSEPWTQPPLPPPVQPSYTPSANVSTREKAGKALEIDFVKLVKVLLRNIWLIILLASIGGSAAYYYVHNYVYDVYTASATLYVYTNNPNQTNYQYANQADLNTATRLMETYMVVIRSNKVMEAVLTKVGFGFPPDVLAQLIRVGPVQGTEVMKISVTTHNPQLSMDICNAVAEFAPAEIIRVVNAGLVEVIDYATLPEVPDSKGTLTKIGMGVIGGIVLACGILLVLMLTDRHVRSEKDLEKFENYEVLSSIPTPKRHKKLRKTPDGRPIPKAELKLPKMTMKEKKAYKRIDRMIISPSSSPDDVEVYKLFRVFVQAMLNHRSILMVTSSVPSEGKSSVSANLAIVSAMDGRRVLLLEADMRKPTQHSNFRFSQSGYGLSDVLLGQCDFDHAVQRDVRQGLDILFAGEKPTKPVEMLHSGNMVDLLMRVRNEYELIIIDTPPINVVADALVLADLVDGTVLITRRDVSRIDEVNTALHRASKARLSILGLVFTGAKHKRAKKRNRRYYSYKNYGAQYTE